MTESQSPTRLLDDPNLGAALRHDLELAQAQAPLAYDVQAGLARFEQTLASPGAGATATAAGAPLRMLGWLLGASVLLGGGIGAADLLTQQKPERPSAAIAARVDIEPQIGPEDAPVAGSSSSAMREPVAEAQADQRAPQATGEAVALGDTPEPPRPVAKPKSDGDQDPAAPTLADEATQINLARKALANDPAQALALVEAAEQQFPKGAMIQERRGYAILALVALGRSAEAEQRADAYLDRWPNGTLSRRVRDALGR